MTENDEELKLRCTAVADERNADFVLRRISGGWEAMFVKPRGADPDSLAPMQVEGYDDNTAWGAMRRLLDVPGARAEGRR